MATQRTFEEKMQILDRCMELEKTGGDILGYLWSQNYLTPRATWFNYQREFLGRRPYEFTDGKPRKQTERIVYAMRRKNLTKEEKQRAVQIAMDGGDPRKYLGNDLELADPNTAWYKIKVALKKSDPELYNQLPKRIGCKANVDKGMPKQAEQVPTVKVDGPIVIETEKPEEVTVSAGDAMKSMEEAADEFFGKCEQMGLMRKEPKVRHLSRIRFNVTAVETEYGEFYRDKKFNCIDWRNLEGDELSMKLDLWKKLAEELPEILMALGVYQE